MKFVLQGRPGSGKTSKLLQLALLSARKGCQVLIVGVCSRLRSVPLEHVIATDTDEILNRIVFRSLELLRVLVCVCWCSCRYVETIEDVINVFIRLHVSNVAPHVVLVDDISTMHYRDKMCLPCSPICSMKWRVFCSAAATVAVLCNSLEWIEKTNRSPSLAIICDTTDAHGSSTMWWYSSTFDLSHFFSRFFHRGFITGRWAFQTYSVSEFDPDAVAQKLCLNTSENEAVEYDALFGDE